MNAPARLWTAGHSNRSLEAFLALCRTYELGCIVDVRRHLVDAETTIARGRPRVPLSKCWKSRQV